MSETTTAAKAPKASATSTGTPARRQVPPPEPPAHPLIGTVVAGAGAIAVTVDGVELDVDPKTGKATGLRA
jgi:hypothetical protein